MKVLVFLLFISSMAMADQNIDIQCNHGSLHGYANHFKGSITVNLREDGFAEASANLVSSQLVLNEQTGNAETKTEDVEISILTGVRQLIKAGEFAAEEIESITLGSSPEQSPKIGLQLSMGSKSVWSILTVNGVQFTAECSRSLD